MSQLDLSFASRIEKIRKIYAFDTGMPSQDAWWQLGKLAPTQTVTLVNFFKFREWAAYPASAAGEGAGVSGREAFDRYAAVSMPCLQKVGGRFLLVAPFGATFIGDSEDWDLVAVGAYEEPSAVLALFEDPDYRQAYTHRVAACARQSVSLCIG
ncbi:MAG: DUF1330 domain-containing protein [Rhodobacteraceae bacterium]|nr:DUF1330 domain-containing protein [Paracoccaceae bacterium]